LENNRDYENDCLQVTMLFSDRSFFLQLHTIRALERPRAFYLTSDNFPVKETESPMTPPPYSRPFDKVQEKTTKVFLFISVRAAID